ncbi:hypothetical protein L6164_019612 [Bauhinia variegata]|uniref:Uncharacterized protein n=1 Tax=Bauhinia variegata TaxID=167791 RepID=A0ACB9MSL5_BAUVA|nr:hypothetical protein L6164_019612 [Bauhinia variegata]
MIWLLKSSGTTTLKQAKQQKVMNGSASKLKQLILGTTSGTEVATSVQIDLPFFFRKKKLSRHARSLLGSAHGHVERTVTTNAGDAVEDIAEMDYAQPHKKPPIHNEKP